MSSANNHTDIDAELNEDLASLNDDISADLDEDMGISTLSNKNDQGKLTTAMRALDYTGGYTRAKLAQLAGLVKQDEIDRGIKLKGDFPSSDELLGRAGVPDSKLRGVAGFAGDMLIDPSFFAGIVAKFAKQGWNIANAIRHLGRPIGSGFSTAGESMFKSAFKEMDLAARSSNKGEKAVSDVAWKYKDKLASIDPRTIRLSDRYNALMSELKSKRDAVRDASARAGAKFDPDKNIGDSIQYIEHLKRDPETAGLANQLEERMIEYLEKGKQPLDVAEQWKETASTNARNQYRNPITPNDPLARAYEARASDFRDGIVNSIDEAIPGQGNVYDSINKDLGPLLTGSNTMERNVGKAVRANVFTPVDAMFGTVASTQAGLKGGIEGVAMKKIADNLKFPGPRVAFGYGMDSYGRSTLALPFMKRLAIEYDRDNLWDEIFNQAKQSK